MTRRNKAGSKKRAGVRTKRGTASPIVVSTLKKVKLQKWPFKDVDSPVGLALFHIDSLLDRIAKGKLRTIDATCISQLTKLDAQQLKEVNERLKLTASTMKSAISGDAFDLESYSNFTKPQLKIAVELLKRIKDLKPDVASSGKKIRVRMTQQAPRKKKEKSPSEIAKTTLYLESDEETGVTGIKPEDAVGCSELWIYNTKTRKLGCYYAAQEHGISFKGTTVVNYDEKRSTTKTIRKPKTQVFEFMQGGIRWMRGYWGALRSVSQLISPRLTRETLILKAHH